MCLRVIGVKLDGVPTDIAIGNYKNQLLIVISQTKKFGSFIRVDRELFKASENQENIFNIQSLFGRDCDKNYLFVRILAEYINSPKPLIFVLHLEDYSYRTAKALIEVLKKNKF